MTTPRCDTCPWWTRQTGAADGKPYNFGPCHNAQSVVPNEDRTHCYEDWWCSLHPDAPKPVYEREYTYGRAPAGEGWEYEGSTLDQNGHGWAIWRRITGYTNGSSDE